jgi:hypothetical protein
MRKAERIEGAQMRKTAPTPEIPPQVSLGQAIVSRLPAGLQTVERDHNSKGWWHVSFNVPNWGFIASGASFPVGYTFGGQNMGAQFAEGMPQNPGGVLISDQEGISMDFNGGINYQFTLTNWGLDTTFGSYSA